MNSTKDFEKINIQKLLKIIVCPSCKGKLCLQKDKKLHCECCEIEYNISNNVPVLLTQESTETFKRFFSNKKIEGENKRKLNRAIKKKIIDLFEPPPRIVKFDNRSEKLQNAWDQALTLNKRINSKQPKILVIGNLRMNSASVKSNETFNNYKKKSIQMDISVNKGTDIVADGYRLPFPDNSLDLIVSQATMKHMANPVSFIKEINRVLKKGGVFYAEFAYFLIFHRWPGDYFRFTPLGIKELLNEFKILDIGSNRGPSYAVAEILSVYTGCLLSFNNKYLYGFFRRVSGWILHPLRYLDYFLMKNKWADLICQVNFCIAKKK